ncbi:hypothetical protein WA026_015321 [Henosepilachna vigintioctopunctata]|uniref:Uncharacterized protein n=1 Tax=Henosepilachna vigintioctopunctata TaxID=420089 RepID=A0AAW1UJE9_9CUCU
MNSHRDNTISNITEPVIKSHYRGLSIKNMKLQCSIFFNNQCVKHGLRPKYLHIKINRELKFNASEKCLSSLYKLLLREEIRLAYQKIYTIDLKLKRLYDIMRTSLSPVSLDHIRQDIFHQVDYTRNKKSLVINKKIKNLKLQKNLVVSDSQTYAIHDFKPPVLNFTNIVFDNKEMELLSKGFKFNISPSNSKQAVQNLEILAVESESILHKYSDIITNPDSLRSEIKNIIKSEKQRLIKSPYPLYNNDILLKKIKKRISENDIIITKSDKSSAMCLLNREDYNNKIKEFFNNNNINAKKIPITSFKTKV